MSGLKHIVKRRLHLFGRTNTALLQIDAHNFDADLVAIQNGLHQLAHARGDLVALLGQCRIHTHLAHDLAHGCFCSLHHGIGRVLALEQPCSRVVQTVLHRKLDFDDVFVFRQHRGITQPRAFDHAVTPYVSRADLCHENELMPLDRIGQPPVDTCPHSGLVLAKLGDHCLLAFLDDENAGSHPDDKGDTCDQPCPDARIAHVWLKAAPIAATPAPTATAEQA